MQPDGIPATGFKYNFIGKTVYPEDFLGLKLLTI